MQNVQLLLKTWNIWPLGPYSQGQLLARVEQQPTPLSRVCAFWLTRVSTWWKYFFLLSIHCPSRPLKAFQFENPVLTLRSDIVGGGRNLLIRPRISSLLYPGCPNPLNKQIKDENLPLLPI